MFGWRLRRIMDNLKHWSQKCLRHQFSLPTNPSFLLWFQGSDIVSCLLRRKDGLLLSFMFYWIITLLFFICPFITDLSVFLSSYTTVQVSHFLSTQGWPHWAHLQFFLSTPIGPSGEQNFSNLEQTLIWAIPYQHLITNCIWAYHRKGFYTKVLPFLSCPAIRISRDHTIFKLCSQG